jgi:hypothetical protein
LDPPYSLARRPSGVGIQLFRGFETYSDTVGLRDACIRCMMIASAVAEGLQSRAGLGRGDGKPEADAAEPLAEWEQELLASATATSFVMPLRLGEPLRRHDFPNG